MIKKIISGGQSGASRAALDTALKLDIPLGGWIPKSRKTENGPLPDKYQMQEMPFASYSRSAEQNVLDSDGTLIISHGALTGGSAYTRKMAMKHGKYWFHTDLNKLPTFQAAMRIEEWVGKNRIETLNVAGPHASKDPLICDLVTVILELVFSMGSAKDERRKRSHDIIKVKRVESKDQPTTVEEAVNLLISRLSLKDKSAVAKMEEDDLRTLHFSIGLFIRNRLLYPRNEKLLESCRRVSKDKYLHWEQASTVITKRLWEKLKRTHKLRVVK